MGALVARLFRAESGASRDFISQTSQIILVLGPLQGFVDHRQCLVTRRWMEPRHAVWSCSKDLTALVRNFPAQPFQKILIAGLLDLFK